MTGFVVVPKKVDKISSSTFVGNADQGHFWEIIAFDKSATSSVKIMIFLHESKYLSLRVGFAEAAE